MTLSPLQHFSADILRCIQNLSSYRNVENCRNVTGERRKNGNDELMTAALYKVGPSSARHVARDSLDPLTTATQSIVSTARTRCAHGCYAAALLTGEMKIISKCHVYSPRADSLPTSVGGRPLQRIVSPLIE